MRILSFLHGHNSSACLLDDKGVRGCISEERYDRKKNSTAFPTNSINYLLKEGDTKCEDVDLIVHASKIVPFINENEIKFYEDDRVGKVKTFRGMIFKFIHSLYYHIPITRRLIKLFYLRNNKRWQNGNFIGKINEAFSKKLNLKDTKIVYADHHTCHAYSVYYGFIPKEKRKESFLVFTLDGEGDGLCATIHKVVDGKWERISSTDAGNSIASFYGSITKFMGMKVNEHEFKVMGLAPYCSDFNRDKVLNKLDGLFWINDDLSFGAMGGGNFTLKWLEENLKYDRFDGVAAAAQKYVENLSLEWVKKTIDKTGIHNIALSGGFFMNIKANKEIMELPEVESLFVCPSGGDESCPIGAVYYGLEQLGVNPNDHEGYISNIYLGNEFTDDEIMSAVKSNCSIDLYNIETCSDIEMNIAQLLADGKVVARFNGRSEFGARALGNRSILANPSNPDVIKLINEQIKSRDFWMPFACSVLDSRAGDYLINPKGVDLKFMAVSCDTHPLARKDLIGGIHPYDYTARPQIVTQTDNPSYHAVLSKFNALTNIGGVLNTSMNIHGEPLVNSPEDALSTFIRSGLQYIALGNVLVSKNN